LYFFQIFTFVQFSIIPFTLQQSNCEFLSNKVDEFDENDWEREEMFDLILIENDDWMKKGKRGILNLKRIKEKDEERIREIWKRN
jgi:hypothetical protein